MILAEATTSINWNFVFNLATAIGTAGMFIVAMRKKEKVSISPQPLEVKVSEELHRQFASKEDFKEHVRADAEEHGKIHGRLDDAIADYNEKFQHLPSEVVALLRNAGALKKDV